MKLITVKRGQLLYEPGVPPTRAFVDSVRGQMGESCPSGVLEPVWVEEAPEPGFYNVLCGSRRVQAIEQIGEVEEIPALLLEDGDGLVLSLVSNFHRSDNPVSEARALLALQEERGWDEEQISETLAISISWVRQRLALLKKLHPGLIQKVAEGAMPISAARRAFKLNQGAQAELAGRERVTMKDVEDMRRAQRMALLDLDTISVPAGAQYAILATQIQMVANSFNGNKRKVLLEAAKILKELI